MRQLQATMKDREEFRELINRHIDAGTCYLCNKPVEDFAPRHSPTGAHWDCVSELKASVEPPARPSGRALARANGGFLIHIVDRANDISLCGHRPKSKTRMSRAGWKWCHEVPRGFELCKKCEATKQLVPASEGSE